MNVQKTLVTAIHRFSVLESHRQELIAAGLRDTVEYAALVEEIIGVNDLLLRALKHGPEPPPRLGGYSCECPSRRGAVPQADPNSPTRLLDGVPAAYRMVCPDCRGDRGE